MFLSAPSYRLAAEMTFSTAIIPLYCILIADAARDKSSGRGKFVGANCRSRIALIWECLRLSDTLGPRRRRPESGISGAKG